jgi:hypothetical protein
MNQAQQPIGRARVSHVGIVCTGEAYTQVVKLTFARGASLEDPRGCSTPASRETSAAPSTSGRQRVLDAEALKALIQAAVAELWSSAPKSKSLGAASRRMGGAADQAVRPYEVTIAATSGAELLPHGRGLDRPRSRRQAASVGRPPPRCSLKPNDSTIGVFDE